MSVNVTVAFTKAELGSLITGGGGLGGGGLGGGPGGCGGGGDGGLGGGGGGLGGCGGLGGGGQAGRLATPAAGHHVAPQAVEHTGLAQRLVPLRSLQTAGRGALATD